ncbi:glycoside hydrolase family 27 protein [Pinibacter aurantiacus]|uniref:alpha-galactosidase n=1 Tax=Pinibacter aurantiacus TaxID=2851599 RepID=A0A9E2W637_9BACT|nr:glycoside hydrolase family 27 protein [Pinibacter aurantiacus]MBV4359629.1 glycoside hydrolase family 27 protein [Pinibacter aurantiacus]
MKKLLFAVSLLCGLKMFAQKTNGLALTPPMGWNSWNTFQTKIDEKMVMEVADMFVSSGMRDAGYTYIVLDDGWMAMDRDENGNLVPDPQKFPHGIKAVADYVHSRGLKFGIYNCAGTKTCAGYPGTRGYEYNDARLYASWGVDYLKFDWCNSDGINAKEAYTTMSKALTATKRPIVFSLCEWGGNKPWEWAANVGHLWRTTGDIYNCFEGIHNQGTWNANCVMKIVDLQKDLRQYSGPGHWNDPDMLEVGNGMTEAEDRTHFSIWCMMAATLMAGNDIRSMSAATKDILTNKEMIGVDQDALGIQGYSADVKDSVEIWIKPLQNNELAVCFLNRSGTAKNFIYNWKENTVNDTLSKTSIDFSKTKYNLRDLWQKKASGTTDKPFKATIQPHDVVVLKLSR